MALPYYGDPNAPQPSANNFSDYYRAPMATGKRKPRAPLPYGRPQLLSNMQFGIPQTTAMRPMPQTPAPPQLRYGSAGPGGMFRVGPAVPYGNAAYQNVPAPQPMYGGGSQHMNYSVRDGGGNMPGEWDYRPRQGNAWSGGILY